MARVLLVNHSDVVPDLVELFSLVFSTATDIETWEWKHLQNPLNPSGLKITIAVDDGKIVGARPFMLANLKAHKKTILAGQPCDTMVHPNYRRQGIFAEMNRLALKYANELGVSLFYNFPNQRSGAGYLKQGWQKITLCEQLMRLENPVELAKARFGSGLGSTIIGRSYAILFGRTPPGEYRGEGCTWRIETSNEAVAMLEGLSSLYQEQRIELDRSLSCLKWRVDSHPRHEYRYVMCLDEEKLIGYVLISRSKTRNGLWVGQIADYVVGSCDSDCICAMFERAVLEMANMGCDMLSTWAPADKEMLDVFRTSLGLRSTLEFPLRLAFRGDPLWLTARETDMLLPSSDLCVCDPATWRLTPLFCDTV
jgi:GNAT superfamily N-acetyltransferase